MTSRPRVVIVGAGFGGLAAAKALRRTPLDVVLVNQHNHKRRHRSVAFHLVRVRGAYLAARQMATDDGPIPYDYWCGGEQCEQLFPQPPHRPAQPGPEGSEALQVDGHPEVFGTGGLAEISAGEGRLASDARQR